MADRATMRENAKDLDQAIDKRAANKATASAVDDLNAYADIAQVHANGPLWWSTNRPATMHHPRVVYYGGGRWGDHRDRRERSPAGRTDSHCHEQEIPWTKKR